MSKEFDTAVVIGRFQPFHKGHATLLKMALAGASRVVVVLGSSFHARSPKNPFTWQERESMIGSSFSEAERARIRYVPVRDYYDDERWANAVRSAVANQAQGKVALMGYFKDASSYYLNHFPHWELRTCESTFDIDATRIRNVLLEAENVDVSLEVVKDWLPDEVRQYLRAWTLLPHYAPLMEEQQAINKYREIWKAAPYAPTFVTVDAVVKTSGHVLLIQRSGFPGKGTWALPGGFLDQQETLLQGAMRELVEETKLGVLESTLLESLVEVKVFDHPGRSLRGRTVTHAHYFDLKTEHLPDISAADDAAQAEWVEIAALAGMEDRFNEDHFHILDQFLRLTGD